MARSTAAEVARRVDAVYDLLLQGVGRHGIQQYAASPRLGGLGAPARHLRRPGPAQLAAPPSATARSSSAAPSSASTCCS